MAQPNPFDFTPIHGIKKEKLLWAIRTMPFCSRCGSREGVQAAHYSGLYSALFGKGAARKCSDTMVAALCVPCHESFDQYREGNNEARANQFFICILRTYHWLWQSGSIDLGAGGYSAPSLGDVGSAGADTGVSAH